jgi:transcriptional regulator with XRE-family HTH domain
MSNDSEMSTVLAVLRLIRGWSQGELSRAAGIRASSISDYERGKKVPSQRTLERLMTAMGYPASFLPRVLEGVWEGSFPGQPSEHQPYHG